MNGLQIVNAGSVWTLAVVIIAVAMLYAVGLQLLTRRLFGVDLLRVNHDVAGFKFAVVGVAYAVLLALVVISVWDDYERADETVQAEAERFYNLYRNSYNFPSETGERMRDVLIGYATEVRDKDWPAMREGLRGSVSAADAYDRLSLTVGSTRPSNLELLPSVTHAIDLLKETADLRLERLSYVGGHVTPVAWTVLLLGALVTLGYCAFFATKQVAAQIIMTAGLAAIIGSTFFLMLILNYPFAGPHAVTAQPIDDVIQRMQQETASRPQSSRAD